MSKVLPVLLATVLLAGCKLSTGSGVAVVTAPVHVAGMWQATTILVQKYRNALFEDATTGKQLDPDQVLILPPAQVTLDPGDMDELFYNKGRLRYTYYAHDDGIQPYVIERALSQADFEQLDQTFYDDNFFNQAARNWDAKTRLPLFLIHYEQNGVAHESSYTPSIAALPKMSAALTTYLGQLDGDAAEPAGVTQTAYALSVSGSTLTVALTNVAVDKDGDAVETPVPLTGVTVDLGKGPQAAQLVKTGKGNAFSFTLPSAAGAYENAVLAVTPTAPLAAWNTSLPVRTLK